MVRTYDPELWEFEGELEEPGYGEEEFERFLEGEEEALYEVPPVFICRASSPPQLVDRFAFNRSTLTQRHKALINRIARRVVASLRTSRPIRTITIDGHTDNRGPDQYNEQLGQRRTLSVQQELIRAIERQSPGLSRRITFLPRSFGEKDPIASNNTPAGRARNRRVEVCLFNVLSRRTRPHAPRPPARPRDSGFRACVADCVRNFEMRLGRPLTREERFRLRRRCIRDCRGRVA